MRIRFSIGDMVIKLIYINVFVFLLVNVMKLGFFLFQNSAAYSSILHHVSLPASLATFVKQPWTLLSYMFLHEDFFHLLFNMLWLYWFGGIFTLYLGDKRVLPLYILGGISGAVFYIASFNLIPVFEPSLQNAVLMGASASILAIVFGAVTLNPNHQVFLVFFGEVRIKYIALFTLVVDVISIPRGNAGGYIAHLGGACCGWLFIRGLRHGIDVFSPIQKVADTVTTPFAKKQHYEAVRKERVAYLRSIQYKPSSPEAQVVSEQERVDEILDKISRSGYDSLSEEEKKFLFEYSNK